MYLEERNEFIMKLMVNSIDLTRNIYMLVYPNFTMHDMECVVKVTRNYQVTIPSSVRLRADIKEGSFLKVVYDEREGVIKLIPLKRKRLTIRLGRRIGIEEIEEASKEMLDEATA